MPENAPNITIYVSPVSTELALALAAVQSVATPERVLNVYHGADGLGPNFESFAAAKTYALALSPAPSSAHPVLIRLFSKANGAPEDITGADDWFELQQLGIFVSSSYLGYDDTPVVGTVPTTLSPGKRVLYASGDQVRMYVGDLSGNAVWIGKEMTGAEVRDELISLQGYDRLPSRAVKDVEQALGVRKFVVGLTNAQVQTVLTETESLLGTIVGNGILSLPTTLPYSPKLGLYAAAKSGSNSAIATSSDGVSWTAQTTPTASSAGTNVIWVEELGLFVATYGFSGNCGIIISSDGVTWTLVKAIPSITLGTIAWSPTLGVLLVSGSATSSVNNLHISTDGVNWTAIGQAGLTGNVTWVDEFSLFILGNGFYSLDGTTWTALTKPAGAIKRLQWVDELGKLFALIGNTTVAVSTNGTTFTTVLTTAATTSSQILTWSPELGKLIVSGGSGTTRIYVTEDGVTWTQPTTPNVGYQQMVWVRELGVFIAGLGSGFSSITNFSTSADAVTWTNTSKTYAFGYWLPEVGRFVYDASPPLVSKSILQAVVSPIAATVKPYLATLFQVSATWVLGELDEYSITTYTDDHDIAGASVSSPGNGVLLIEFNDLPAGAFVRGATLPLDLGGDEGGLTTKIVAQLSGSNLTLYATTDTGDVLESFPVNWFEVISANA